MKNFYPTMNYKELILPDCYVVHPEVAQAIKRGAPVVALESTVITHGLPQPENLSLAQQLETEIRSFGAIPATIAILAGQVHVGLTPTEMEELAALKAPTRKISRRDFGIAIANKENGGTTVAGTLIVARTVGIQVFATGGIGGVHRNTPFDVSADLGELAHSPLVVVCAGAKAILDLPATIEVLETHGVPIVGYQTSQFPSFYSSESGLFVNFEAKNPQDIAQIAHSQWSLGLGNGILVVQPPPKETAIPAKVYNEWIDQAIRESKDQNIIGSAMTPFLLKRISELSSSKSLLTNLALLSNNARLAAQIACAMHPLKRAIV
jgi:pseudouridylate synthase